MRIISTVSRLALAILAFDLSLGVISGSTSANASVRIRDGRQIYLALTTAVGLRTDARALSTRQRPWVDRFHLESADVTFRETLSGLPEFGSVAELAPSLPAVLRLVSNVCELHARRVTYKDYFGFDVQDLPPSAVGDQLNARIRQDKSSPNRYRPPQLAKMAKIATVNTYRLILRRSPTPAEEAAVLAALDPREGRAQNVLEAHALACAQSASSFEFLEVPPRRQVGGQVGRGNTR